MSVSATLFVSEDRLMSASATLFVLIDRLMSIFLERENQTSFALVRESCTN